ncbi:hypothetical protein L204_101065 [Cryptococcus depauperatus]
MLVPTLLGPTISPAQLLHARNIAGPSRDPSRAFYDYELGPEASFSSETPEERPLTRNVVGFFNQEAPNEGWTEEELAWYDKTVVWSRGVEVFRRYTYDYECEDVAFACFVWFKVSVEGQNEHDRSNLESDSSSSRDTFGPFHRSQHTSWGGPRHETRFKDGSRLERTLVVFLQTRAHVYYGSGEDVTVHLPFNVEGAWGLPEGGMLVQRKLERRERRRMSKGDKKTGSVLRGMADQTSMSILDDLIELEDETAPSLPRLFTLENPFDELKMVVQGQVEDDCKDTKAFLGSNTRSIATTTVIVYVSPETYPLVVTHNQMTGNFVFYRRVRVSATLDKPLPVGKPASTMRPEELLRQADIPQAPSHTRVRLSSLQRNTTTFGPTAEERRMPTTSDLFDRTHCRVPRLSRGPIADPSSTDELQAALDPPCMPSPTTKHRRNRKVSGLPPASFAPGAATERIRRTSQASSFIIHDRHAPETQMALQVAADKDLRETTMMMGLERDETGVRSDIILSPITTWQQPFDIDPAQARVFLTEYRDSHQVTVNLHLVPARPGSTRQPQLYSFRFESVRNTYKIYPSPPIKCLSAIPILSYQVTKDQSYSGSPIYDILIISDGHLQLITTGNALLPFSFSKTRYNHSTIVKLIHPVGSRFTAIFKDGEASRYSIDIHVQHELTDNCLRAMSNALLPQDFSSLRLDILQSLQALPTWQQSSEDTVWPIFERALSKILRLDIGVHIDDNQSFDVDQVVQDGLLANDPTTRRISARLRSKHKHGLKPARLITKTDPSSSIQHSAVLALLCLHLVAQDLRLSKSRRKGLRLVTRLVKNIAIQIGREDWFDYWERILPTNSHHVQYVRDSYHGIKIDTNILNYYDQPPDILLHLSRQLECPTRCFPNPNWLVDMSAYNSQGHDGSTRVLREKELVGEFDSCVRTSLVTSIYRQLGPGIQDREPLSLEERVQNTVKTILAKTPNLEWLEDLPYGVAFPILEALRACQCVPEKNWSKEMYMLIGRPDLAMQGEKGGAESLTKDDWPNRLGPEPLPSIGDIISIAISNIARSNKKTSFVMPHVRFGTDRRLQEVERIMQTIKLRTVTLSEPKGANPEDVARYQQSFVNTLANRTLAITVGQGMFEYGTRATIITDAWEIPFIELSVKITPGNNVLKAEIVSDNVEWPCFHNGVSAGLSISPDCKGIDSSWIVFNRPQVLNSEHGGFLLGLGLTGHLRSLMTYHAFPLMEPRHDFTSVGLLLGLASSFAGSNDLLITKILSLHTHALLPLGSMELNASPVVQSTALIGLGLVYVGSRNLRMAEIALNEIGRREMPNVDGFVESQESYSFSAAMSFGLIMLGRGGSATSEVDRKMLAHLRKCIVGDVPQLDASKARMNGSGVDINVTTPGATLALGLVYLKTMRNDVAGLLKIPQMAYDLDHAKPEWLLLRTFARALIMWNDVCASHSWVEQQVPSFILSAIKSPRRGSVIDLGIELAYISIISGAGLAIGLKYAGTATEMAHNTILTLYNVLAKTVTNPNMSYEGRIKRTTARQCLNVVTLALAAVMSGTGELGVLRRLRVSHGQEGAGVTYGTHMAMHMALGLLFLGRGQYTLGSSNLAIAAMSIAFFPRFSSNSSDNKAYPQAFRHLWALAVEARCLTARDVDTLETVYLPVKLRFREGNAIRQQSLISPTQLPSFDRLLSIEVDSPRYWPIKVDFSDPRDMKDLVGTRTIYVKRKAGFIDYDSDPKGNRSIFVRVGSMTGIDLQYDLISPGAPPSVAKNEVQELVQVHCGDAALVGLANRFEGIQDQWGGGVGSFLGTIIIECLALDKPSLIGVYLEMYFALRKQHAHMDEEMEDCEGMEDIAHFGFAKSFYDDEYDKNFAHANASGERRFALVRHSFLNAAKRSLLGQSSMTNKRSREWQVERKYLQSGIEAWEENAVEVSRWLAKNNVPPLPLLQALKELVKSKQGEELIVLELLVRKSAERYWECIKSGYDKTTGSVVLKKTDDTWKLHSVKRAIEHWTS